MASAFIVTLAMLRDLPGHTRRVGMELVESSHRCALFRSRNFLSAALIDVHPRCPLFRAW